MSDMIRLALVDAMRSWTRLKMLFITNVLFSSLVTLLVAFHSFLFEQFGVYSALDHRVLFNYTIISNLFSFISFLIFASIISWIVSNAVLFSLHIEKRRADIATMKAHGMPAFSLVLVFFFQHAIIFLTGFAAGSIPTVIGSMIFFHETVSWGETSFYFVLFFLTGNAFAIFWSTRRKITNLYTKTVAGTMRSEWVDNTETIRSMTRSRRFLRKLGPTILYSYKTMITRRHDTQKAFAIVACSMLLCGTIFTGSAVIATTYEGMIDSSLAGDASDDVIVIGHQEVAAFIQRVYEAFTTPQPLDSFLEFNYSAYLMDPAMLDLTAFEEDIRNQDWRFTFIANVQEKRGIRQDPQETGYIEVGKDRSLNAVMFGVQFSSMFNTWNGNVQPGAVLIGDSIAGLMFEDVAVQKLGVRDMEYRIASSVFDSAFNGFSVYMDIDQVRLLLNVPDVIHNCVFITLERGRNDDTINALNNHVRDVLGEEYVALPLKDTFSTISGSIGTVFALHVIVATIVFAFMMVFQLELVKILVYWNKRDYNIMPCLGVPPAGVRQILLEQLHLVSIPATLVAFALTLVATSMMIGVGGTIPSILVPVVIFCALQGTSSLVQFTYLKTRVRFAGGTRS